MIFIGSSPAAHNVLSDVLGNFLSNFTQLLRMNVNRNSGGRGCLGFQDALERSLHQTGMGGKDGVCGYWQTEVKGQARVLDMEADELRNLYFRSTVSCVHAVNTWLIKPSPRVLLASVSKKMAA